MIRKNRIVASILGIATFAIMLGVCYGAYQIAYLRGVVAGSSQKTTSDIYFGLALLHQMETFSSKQDAERIRQYLSENIREDSKSLELAVNAGAQVKGLETLRKTVEKSLHGVVNPPISFDRQHQP